MNSTETLGQLLQKVFLAKIAYPEHFPNANTERRESLIDQIEPRLMRAAQALGLPYLRPTLTQTGEAVLSYSPDRFVRRYKHELSFTCRSGMEAIIL